MNLKKLLIPDPVVAPAKHAKADETDELKCS